VRNTPAVSLKETVSKVQLFPGNVVLLVQPQHKGSENTNNEIKNNHKFNYIIISSEK
jgi:hypothetical protein